MRSKILREQSDLLDAAVKRVESLREDLLFGSKNNEAMNEHMMDGEAVQNYLLALNALEQAQRFMNLAALQQGRFATAQLDRELAHYDKE